jgi:hypothetical protein
MDDHGGLVGFPQADFFFPYSISQNPQAEVEWRPTG